MDCNIYLTIKDEEGLIMPSYLWKDDKNLKYHQPDIDKFLKKNKNCKLVKVKIVEL